MAQEGAGMDRRRINGFIVPPGRFAEEDPARILERLQRRAGANAIAIPCDGAHLAFRPDLALYRGLRYAPPTHDAAAAARMAALGRAIRAAKAESMTVLLMLDGAPAGGLQDEDVARLPDGTAPALASGGGDDARALASPHLRAIARATAIDALNAHPQADGLIAGRSSYPTCTLDPAFLDFGPHARDAAAALGLDFAAMQSAASSLRAHLLGRLTAQDLTMWTERDGGRFRMLQALIEIPALHDWLSFKARLGAGTLAAWRAGLDAAAPGKALVACGPPPPLSTLAGFSFRGAAATCDAVIAPLRTAQWCAAIRAWGETLAAANPALRAHPALPRTLAAMLDVVDDAGFDRLEDWRAPAPDEAHPVGQHAQTRKLRNARAEAGERPVWAMAQAAGPLTDFARRFAIAWAAAPDGAWTEDCDDRDEARLDAIGAIAGVA